MRDVQGRLDAVDITKDKDNTKISIITINSDTSEEEKKDDSRMEIEEPLFQKGDVNDDDTNNLENTLTLSKRSSIRMSC